MSKFNDLILRLSQTLGNRLALGGYRVALESDQLPAPKAYDKSAADARHEAWLARVEPGLEQRPVEEWPQVRVGERVGLMAHAIREAFDDSFSAMARSSVCLMHRLHQSGAQSVSVSAASVGSKAGTQAERFELSVRRLTETQMSQIQAQNDVEDASELSSSAIAQSAGVSARLNMVPEAGRAAPREKFAPVWNDAIFCAQIADQLRVALGVEWSEAMQAAAFAVVVLDHASQSNAETLAQTAKGLSDAQPKSDAKRQEMENARFELRVRREETLSHDFSAKAESGAAPARSPRAGSRMH